MEIDQSDEQSSKKPEALRSLIGNGVLPISIAKLSGSSRIIPSDRDFHFYNNFQEFKNPVKETDTKSKNLLKQIGGSENMFGKVFQFPDDVEVELDEDAELDWLENVNDEIFERFDASLDEFRELRKKEEESGVRMMRVSDDHELSNGFQMVHGKKNKKSLGSERNVDEVGAKGAQEVKVAAKLKPKIPFHIPTIPKPQDEYKIVVNNANQPFEHVWLQKSEDGTRFIHPLEKLCVLDFVDKSEIVTEPVKPPPIEHTPFKFIEEVKDLKQLASKLKAVDEFAVDLEHNQYRSFQGLTCLMQISTRTEDFIIDTLKLRIYVGPHLREVFKDPSKRKVMHGADRDIVWLQRDFGIYVCNMFDTGQASRVLKMERFSLEHLLNHFCGVAANKEYQNADWRLRPLPHEMVKYAREDTHYLLYIYDLMRRRLLMTSAESDSSDPLLIEVYKRSYDICTQLYEKELLTDSTYLYIYGLHGADLNAQQLAIVSGLYEWRDIVARAEDESTGYIMPNRTLIEIAKQMPLTTSNLKRMLKSKHPYIERNLGSVVSIIRHSIQNAAAFEETAEYLKKRRLEMANEANALPIEESEVLMSEVPVEELGIASNPNLPDDLMSDKSMDFVPNKDKNRGIGSSFAKIATEVPDFSHSSPGNTGNEESVTDGRTHINIATSLSGEVTVQALKKPSRAFGALLGSSVKRKFDPDKKEQEDAKLGQIKSTVSLPFHAFSVKDEPLQSNTEDSSKALEATPRQETATGSSLEDIIILDDDSDDDEPEKGKPEAASDDQLKEQENKAGYASESDDDDEISLSDLSSSFERCLSSDDQANSSKKVGKSEPSEGYFQVEPFDYEAARKEVTFGKAPVAKTPGENRGNSSKKKNVTIQSGKDEGTTDLAQGKRRQAFPASGNRSATFR